MTACAPKKPVVALGPKLVIESSQTCPVTVVLANCSDLRDASTCHLVHHLAWPAGCEKLQAK